MSELAAPVTTAPAAPAGVEARTGAPEVRWTRFGSLDIAYDERVLEPRPWTAAQSEWAAELAETAPDGPILELCCGAGQIGLLAARLSGRPLVMVDLSEPACGFARANADRAGVSAQVRHGRMETVLDVPDEFAVVVADPPWVPSAQTGRFPEDPLPAIDGGGDGLAIARTCLMIIARHLMVGGSAVLQVGTPEQVRILAEDLAAAHQLGLEVLDHRTFGTRGVLLRLRRTT